MKNKLSWKADEDFDSRTIGSYLNRYNLDE